MPTPLESLRALSRELYALRSAAGLLAWDQETHMPPKGGAARAESQAALSAATHRLLTSDRLWGLLEESDGPGLSPREKALLRELRRDVEKARKIPEDLATELARTASLAQRAWAQAREKEAPAEFLPWLEKMVALKRREAEALGYAAHPYDALLDQYEPGATVETVKPVLDGLREGLVPLLGRILEKRPPAPKWRGLRLPLEAQRTFNLRLLRDMGFDLEAGRLDESAHPFTDGLHPGDVRLTTRYREDDWLTAIFSTLHEGGHGLYEQGLPEADWGTPLGEAVSLSVHESQSRFWENLVGRSRAYWNRTLPLAQEHFGPVLDGVTVDDILALVNRVEPSFIRVESDEATYNLHIALRFELEEAIFSGALEPAGLDEAWNAGMKKLLGLRPRKPSEGFLQDVHWSCGLFGYFHTYAMGNLYAAQIRAAMEKDLGPLDPKVEAGDFAALLRWLRDRIHRHGREFPGPELLHKATGKDLDPGYFLRYLERKYLG